MRRDLSVFYRQLAMTYRAGLPITQGLSVAAGACQDRRLIDAAADVERRVKRGDPLTPSLAVHPGVFEEVDVALIAVGEENGGLDRNLTALADRAEKHHNAIRRLAVGLIYPALVLVAAFFLPRLSVWVTQGFVAYLLAVLRAALPVLLLIGGAVALVVFVRRGSPESFDRLRIELPMIGKNLKKLALARFAESLALLYAGGVPIRNGIRLAIRAVGNKYLERRLQPMAAAVSRGEPMSKAFDDAGVFPNELVSMVSVGEKTGDLDKALTSLARLYQEEADRAIQALLIILPIAVYLMVAIYVAIIVISAFASYFRLVGGV